RAPAREVPGRRRSRSAVVATARRARVPSLRARRSGRAARRLRPCWPPRPSRRLVASGRRSYNRRVPVVHASTWPGPNRGVVLASTALMNPLAVRRFVLAIALALFARPAEAFHTVFDFSVDRFEVDGNRFGPRDGTPDFVDPFDDLSHWYVPYGTATVVDGHLHVHNPGVHFPGPDGTSLHLTEAP